MLAKIQSRKIENTFTVNEYESVDMAAVLWGYDFYLNTKI